MTTVTEQQEIETAYTKTVYTPESQLNSPWLLLKAMMRDLLDGRELAWRLTIRDISAQYRQSLLGVLWAFILPIANTITWIFLNGTGIVAVGDTALPYPVYVFTGSMLWAIFVDAVNAPLKKLSASKAMLAKINFPREAILLSGIYETIFNGGIKVVLMLAALLFFGIYPGWGLALFPLAFLSIIIAGSLIGLIVTPLGLLYQDIGKAIPLLLQFYMFITPVVFPMPENGRVAMIFKFNPMTPLILTARDWLTGFTPQFLPNFIIVNAVAIVLILFFWVVYRLAMPIIIERMSA